MNRLGWKQFWRLLPLLVAVTGAHSAAPSSHESPVYVGSPACRACHAEQFKAWAGSQHDLAMQPATESTVLGDFNDRVFEYRSVRTRFYRERQHFMVETQGKDDRQHSYEIAYTFGVSPLQQYLVGFPDGRYQALTVAWDTRPAERGGQRWFSLYPDEDTPPGDELNWLAPAHTWNTACAECHSTNLRKGYDAAKDSFSTTWSDIDVGCEACHGPGSRHVQLAGVAQAGVGDGHPGDHGLVVQLGGGAAWRLTGDGTTAERVSEARGAAETELCGRCHARRSRLTEDYRYGAPLSDSHRVALLEEGLYFPDGQIQDEVYVYGSFRQSRMYAAGVTCSDCHEPHSLKLRRDGNALCTGCHKAEAYDSTSHHFHKMDGKGAACVACHMPARTYMVVDRRRDHSFRIPRPDLAASLGVPDACTGCHQDRDADWASAQIRGWYGRDRRAGFQNYAGTLAAARSGSGDAANGLAGLAADAAAPAIARATALEALAAYPGPAYLRTLVNGLHAGDALERIAAVEALAPLGPGVRWKLLSPLLGDPVLGVRIAIAEVLADIPVATLDPDDRPRLQRVFDEYLAAARFNADRPETWVNLAGFRARQGQTAGAEAAYGEALKRDPRCIQAYVNQADLYRALGREDDAERVLRAGIAAVPRAASLRHALGLLLIRTKRTDQALAELKAAYELDGRTPRFGYVYGVALDSAGVPGQALDVWKSVLDKHPNDRDSLQALALGLFRQGKYAQALACAKRLAGLMPGDREARQLVDAMRGAERDR
jgi:predicted CXXCH cytochrome family protein